MTTLTATPLINDDINHHHSIPRYPVQFPRCLTPEDRNTLASALFLGPILFACNWAYYSGLARTTVASSSTIGSTASLFALFFAFRCPTLARGAASIVGVVGVVMIFYHDLIVPPDMTANVDDSGVTLANAKAVGDLLSLVSAAMSGLYSVVIDNTFKAWCCPPPSSDEQLDEDGMKASQQAVSLSLVTASECGVNEHSLSASPPQPHTITSASAGNEMKLVAFIGLAMTVGATAPLFVFGHAPPDLKTVALLVSNALFGEVIPSTIWVRAAKQMSPVVTATAGAVMVPMSVAVDAIVGNNGGGDVTAPTFLCGTVLVLVSFFVLAAEDAKEERQKREKKDVGGRRMNICVGNK